MAEVVLSTAPGYLIYKERVSIHPATSGVDIRAVLPDGLWHQVPAVPPQQVYQGSVPVMVSILGTKPGSFTLEVGLQGCAQAGLCYPPEIRQVVVPAAQP